VQGTPKNGVVEGFIKDDLVELIELKQLKVLQKALQQEK
jgi:hypothetical protein